MSRAGPGDGEAIVAHGSMHELLMVTPILRDRHDPPTHHEGNPVARQVGLGVKLLPERTVADAQPGRVEKAVAAEAVALTLHSAALPFRQAGAVGGARSAPPEPAFASHSRKLDTDIAVCLEQLPVPFEACVDGQCCSSGSSQLRSLRVGADFGSCFRG
jgi:hypothetical protein